MNAVQPHLRIDTLKVAMERFLFPVATLMCVAASVSSIHPDSSIVLAVTAVGVVLLGLPHGALDPQVATRLWGQHRSFTMPRFLAIYTAAATLGAALWLIAPNTALTFFLLISAYHFGSDWQGRGSAWGQFAYGTSVVTLPSVRHADTVSAIFESLGATHARQIANASHALAILAIVIAFLSMLPQPHLRRQDILELGSILLGALFLQPLLFFVLYFCLLHSPRHLMETAARVHLRGLSVIVRSVLPLVAATLVLAALLWHFIPSGQLSGRVLQTLFIGLAALTVPHMLLSEADQRHRTSLPHEHRANGTGS
jgi:Brp/Blh family beta-carotene 15,15'-monooxygenase